MVGLFILNMLLGFIEALACLWGIIVIIAAMITVKGWATKLAVLFAALGWIIMGLAIAGL